METYEEKYKKAVAEVQELIGKRNAYIPSAYQNRLMKIFPELQESENQKIRKWLIDLLSTMQYHHCDKDREMGNKALSWLNYTEWSEEDESHLDCIVSCLNNHDTPCEELLDWFKNRIRAIRPQSRWKPSVRQMDALKNVCVTSKSTEEGACLCELYHNLEKLREE